MKSEDLMQIQNRSSNASGLISYDIFTERARHVGVRAVHAARDMREVFNREMLFPRQRLTRSSVWERSSALRDEVQRSHEILARAQSIAIFPDEVVLDRTKLTIIRRRSPWASDIISIQIEDILNVTTSTGMLFGSLTIASRVMSTVDHFTVNLLWKRDAIELKHIVQGYAIAKHNGIDVGLLDCDELVESLRELGHDSGRE